MNNHTTCARQNKIWKGCKWQPRYHEQSPHHELVHVIMRQWAATHEDKLMLIKHITYVGEVCVTCGKFMPHKDASE
jgi:hypothetical protein